MSHIFMDTVFFAPDLIEYAFIRVSCWDAKIMGGESQNLKWITQHDLTFALIKLLVFRVIIWHPKKAFTRFSLRQRKPSFGVIFAHDLV